RPLHGRHSSAPRRSATNARRHSSAFRRSPTKGQEALECPIVVGDLYAGALEWPSPRGSNRSGERMDLTGPFRATARSSGGARLGRTEVSSGSVPGTEVRGESSARAGARERVERGASISDN